MKALIHITLICFFFFPIYVVSTSHADSLPVDVVTSASVHLDDFTTPIIDVAIPADAATIEPLSEENLPPLSLEECIDKLDVIRVMLDEGVSPSPSQMDVSFEFILDYIRLIDRQHSSVSGYSWYFIGDNRVEPGELDHDQFFVTPVLEQTSAISFTATRGNVWLERLEVVDLKGTRYKFDVKRWILEDMPRKEVCYLYLPITTRQVDAWYTAEESQKPQFAVYGGVSQQPEYLKAAMHYVRLTRQYIRSGEVEGAHETITKAEKELSLFLHK